MEGFNAQVQNASAALTKVLADKLKIVWYTWLVRGLLCFCLVVSGIVAATEASAKSYSFAVIFVALLNILYTAAGTVMLKRLNLRTPFLLGVLVGVSTMMTCMLLLLAVLSGGNVAEFGGAMGSDSPASERAVTAFSIMMFIADLILTAYLANAQDVLLPVVSEGDDAGMPPARGYDTSTLQPDATDDQQVAVAVQADSV